MRTGEHGLIVHGARGSSAVAGTDYSDIGGNTTCLEVSGTTEGLRVLIDAGSGLHHIAPSPGVTRYAIFLTHFHWDHIQGLPFFGPIYDPDVEIDFYAHASEGLTTAELIDGVMRPPWFPVTFTATPSVKRYHDLGCDPIQIDGITVSTARLRHPSGVTAYRMERDGRAFVVATDYEAGDPRSDDALVELAGDADLLIHDAQYLPDQYEAEKRGWGHSTWEHATRAARASGAAHLALTSHDPARTDPEVLRIVDAAAEVFPATSPLRQGEHRTV